MSWGFFFWGFTACGIFFGFSWLETHRIWEKKGLDSIGEMGLRHDGMVPQFRAAGAMG